MEIFQICVGSLLSVVSLFGLNTIQRIFDRLNKIDNKITEIETRLNETEAHLPHKIKRIHNL